MNRVHLLLLIAVLAAALGTVTSQYKARKLYRELEQAQTHARQLDEDYGQLQIEQGTYAAHERIERIASTRLSMRLPNEAQATPPGAPAP
ncbi:MAG: cell division protein FtsL [Zoogloeaceae bacterium]|jgi:cell division protein FtsL|nr:cell division protein FtsL [Zoogloeaceae bacterium]